MESTAFPSPDETRTDGPAVNSRVIVFGETLLDVFPSGPVLGGAPLNVARHLAGLGFQPLLISRVGMDPDGERIREALRRWGLSTKGIQVDEHSPTGRVLISGTPSDPVYEIPEGAAWDRIDGAEAVYAALCWEAEAVVFGTLSRRSEVSGPALDAVLSVSGGRGIVDLNLRAPWFEGAVIEKSLKAAKLAKLSMSELFLAGELLGLPCELPASAAESLVRLFDLDYMAVTNGPGDVLLTAQSEGSIAQLAVSSSTPYVEVVDTVGAGDAFTAVLVAGAVSRWQPVISVMRANELARAICGIQGAVPDDNKFYEPFRAAWEDLPCPNPVA